MLRREKQRRPRAHHARRKFGRHPSLTRLAALATLSCIALRQRGSKRTGAWWVTVSVRCKSFSREDRRNVPPGGVAPLFGAESVFQIAETTVPNISCASLIERHSRRARRGPRPLSDARSSRRASQRRACPPTALFGPRPWLHQPRCRTSPPQRPRSLKDAWSSGRRPGLQWYLRSLSLIGRSLMLAMRRRIRPCSSNSQFSLP